MGWEAETAKKVAASVGRRRMRPRYAIEFLYRQTLAIIPGGLPTGEYRLELRGTRIGDLSREIFVERNQCGTAAERRAGC